MKPRFQVENLIQLWYKPGDKKGFCDELSGSIRGKLSIVDPTLFIGSDTSLPPDQSYE